MALLRTAGFECPCRKFSFLLHGRDGYVDNVVQNREEGRERSGAMRAPIALAAGG